MFSCLARLGTISVFRKKNFLHHRNLKRFFVLIHSTTFCLWTQDAFERMQLIPQFFLVLPGCDKTSFGNHHLSPVSSIFFALKFKDRGTFQSRGISDWGTFLQARGQVFEMGKKKLRNRKYENDYEYDQ